MPAVATPARSGQVRRLAGAAPEDPRTLSVLLVTGFLGAGKTTLVNHLLRSRGELRVAVFVNEFGAVDVDGAFLRCQGSVDKNHVFSLKAGCMCCGSNDDLRVVIDEELSAMREELDLLMIETSGVTDPAPVLATLSSVSGVRVERVVCVVDATTIRNAAFGSSPDARRQTACADVVVLSKIDLLGSESAGAGVVDQWVREICAGGATTVGAGRKPQRPAVVRAENGVVEWAALCPMASLGGPKKKRQKRQRQSSGAAGLGSAPGSKMASGDGADPHETIATYSYCRQQPFNRQRFEEWAQSLPAAVVRAKGLLRVAKMTRPVAWHLAGGRSSELREVDCEEEPWGSELVLLGSYGEGWSPQNFDEALNKCLAGGRKAR